MTSPTVPERTDHSLFSENFWGDVDTFAGFEALNRQMRKGRKEIQEVMNYFKERVAIEEDYHRRLIKLARFPLDNEGFNESKQSADDQDPTLKSAFLQIRESTEKEADRHKLLAADLSQLILKTLEGVKDSQKRTTLEVANEVLSAQKDFSNNRSAVPKLKKAYEAKCRELEAVKDEIEQSGGPISKDKKSEKLTQKMTKLTKEVEQSDNLYSEGVKKLDESRLKWMDTMTNACTTFEYLEIERISTIRNQMNDYANKMEKLHQSYQSIAEAQKTYIECVKPEIDIELFVSTRRTGFTRPGPVIYENFYTGLMKDAIFGIPLADHLNATNRQVPAIVELCCTKIEAQGLTDEGIYRLSGRAAKVRQLRSQFDRNSSSIDLNNDPDIQVNDVASLVKLYLRELPQPLLTFELYDKLMDALKERDNLDRMMKLKGLMKSLPSGNFSTLKFVVRHLKKISEHEEVNKMGVSNLAIVFGPCLVRSENENNALKDFRSQSKLVEDLINYFDQIFEDE